MAGKQSPIPPAVAEFLQQCTTSTQTYEAFKQLLSVLDRQCQLGAATSSDIHQNNAFDLLKALCNWAITQPNQQALIKQYHFNFNEIILAQGSLFLLQLPSIFQPEDWSFTFYEGLSRYRRTDYQDKVLVELGCGNGWISIALALSSTLSKIYGLDINPRAITCARLNVYLNALVSTVVNDVKGQTPLWERVSFHTSDLLAELRDRQIQADWIIGCIPQILAPDPTALKAAVTEYDTDHALHDLSNYTTPQGYLEDQFGLGLIARAIDEAIVSLKPLGKIILNLGGRPGQQVLAQLFLRRGLLLKPIWSTLVAQAADTEIDALVQIEQGSDHRFEFYMTRDASQPICAQTARAFVEAGGDLFHALTVYEAWLPQQDAVLDILKFAQAPGRRDVYDALDLSADDQEQFSERIHYLSKLAKQFESMTHLPYGPVEGRLSLRRGIALFLNNYFDCAWLPENVLIAPARSELLANVLLTYESKRTLFDQHLMKSLDGGRALARMGADHILEVPAQQDLLCQLISDLEPDLVVTGLDALANSSTQSIAHLIAASAACNARLIIDISAHFDLSSQPEKCAALSYLAVNGLPSHVSLICGLIKNRVYTDLHLCFLITASRDFIKHLCGTAELTYSRAPFFAQFYYETLLSELLSFQLLSARGFEKSFVDAIHDNHADAVVMRRDSALQAHAHPAISARLFSFEGDTQAHSSQPLVRLDYGENQLSASDTVKTACFAAFSGPDVEDGSERKLLQGALQRWFSQRCGIADFAETQLHMGAGVAPLFAQTLLHLKSLDQPIVLPGGCYGEFYAAAIFFGVKIIPLETHDCDDFKIDAAALRKILKAHPGAWVYLNVPYSNPTGLRYRSEQLQEIVTVLRETGGRALIDTIYDGLSLASDPGVMLPSDSLGGFEWVIYMGLSKLLACGGLRFGAALSNSTALNESFTQSVYRTPHHTVLVAARKLLDTYLKQDQAMLASLTAQKACLVEREQRLVQCLSACGWAPMRPEGGLFLIAKPVGFLGKSIPPEYVSQGECIAAYFDCASVVALLKSQEGLMINGDDWTGIKDHCRFVLSVTDEIFSAALAALKRFYDVFGVEEGRQV